MVECLGFIVISSYRWCLLWSSWSSNGKTSHSCSQERPSRRLWKWGNRGWPFARL